MGLEDIFICFIFIFPYIFFNKILIDTYVLKVRVTLLFSDVLWVLEKMCAQSSWQL